MNKTGWLGIGNLGFSGVVTIVESEATDDGGFFDGDWRKEVGDCHRLVRDEAVEY